MPFLDRSVAYLAEELDVLLNVLRLVSDGGDRPGDARDGGTLELADLLHALGLMQVSEYLLLAGCKDAHGLPYGSTRYWRH